MSSLINSLSNLSRRVSSWLGISSTPTGATGNPIITQSGVVINSGSEPIPFPLKPDGWVSDETWTRFQSLRAKYPRNFQDANQYINSFTPGEVEMIMKWVGEEVCFMGFKGNATTKIIGDIHLFKRIAETRQTLETAENKSMYPQLEYVKLTYALESMPAQNHYGFKFVGNDTVYKC